MAKIGPEHNIPDQHSEILYMLLGKVDNILGLNKIQYFIEGGTLLGSVRHKGRIPFDDDIDIGVLNKDYHKLEPILRQITDDKYKIVVENHGNMLKVAVCDLWVKNTITGKIIGTPTLDIFRYDTNGDQIRLYSTKDRQRFKNCYFTKSEFYPLKKVEFGPLSVYSANKPENYLFRYYGSDCLVNEIMDCRSETDMRQKTH